MSSGVQNPNVIDFIGYNSEADTLSIVMIEDRNWTASGERLLELQNKVNFYLSFILDGQLDQMYPQYKDKTKVVRLTCSYPPDPKSIEFLHRIDAALAASGIGWELKLLPLT